MSYCITLYDELNDYQKNKIKKFIIKNFKKNIDLGFDKNTIIILYLIENKIIGCCCLLSNKNLKLKINNNSLHLYDLTSDNACFLYNLCVDNDYRNQHIASKLIEYTINEFMIKFNIDYIYTNPENDISKKIFTNFNFIKEKLLYKKINDYINNENTNLEC
jgi:ribosomal protein S18 acetylase RimI-like enzyme